MGFLADKTMFSPLTKEILGGRIYGYNKVNKGRGFTPLEGF